MIRSTSACIAMRARSWLYGSPEIEKIGSFWLFTSVLKRSIIGMPVRTISRGMMRFVGLTDGPPIGIRFSLSVGPLSRGSPEPVKIRPLSESPKLTRIGLPRKRTSSPVEMPRPPAKTWSETISSSSLLTSASETPKRVVTSASSP